MSFQDTIAAIATPAGMGGIGIIRLSGSKALDIAQNLNLPVIIHSRKSLDLVLREIRLRPGLTGVVHSFSGSLQQAQQLYDLGFKLGVGATITFDRAKKLRRIVSHIPLDGLVVESDAPDQSGSMHREERNEPAFLRSQLQVIAQIKRKTEASIICKTTQNSQILFNL